MILTFQTSFPTVDEQDRYADIDVPKTRTVDDLFKVVCAETGVSLTSPMELKINDVLYNRNDKRTIEEAGINEYDMVEVKILKNGGKQVPGNVTVMDLYKALGTRLANTNLGAIEPSSMPVEEPKAPEPVSAPVSTPAVAPAPVSAPVSAPAAPAVAPAPISVPKPNAFSIKAPAAKANAFAVKAPLPKASAFAVKKPVAAAPAAPAVEAAPSVPEPTATPAPAPAASAFAVKPVKPVSAFSVKTGANKFTIKKP